MNIKAEGIIFRSFKYSETSLIMDVFTKEYGLLSFIISGVRKKKSTVSAAMLQVMNLVDIVGFNKNSTSLGRITEIKNNYVHKNVLYDFIKSSVGVFVIELSRNCIKERETNEDIYHFLKQFLIYLDNAEENLGVLPLIFMVRLSQFLGFYPQDNYSNEHNMFDWREAKFITENDQNHHCMDSDASYHFHQLLNTKFESLVQLKIPKSVRHSMMPHLLDYYQYHMEAFKPLKSYKVLEELMAD